MEAVSENNVGKTIKQPRGYHAYFPHKLESGGPRGIKWDNSLINLLADASSALGELNGITKFIKKSGFVYSFLCTKRSITELSN